MTANRSNQYSAEHYDRITFLVPKGQKKVLMDAARREGMKLSSYIASLIPEDLNIEKLNNRKEGKTMFYGVFEDAVEIKGHAGIGLTETEVWDKYWALQNQYPQLTATFASKEEALRHAASIRGGSLSYTSNTVRARVILVAQIDSDNEPMLEEGFESFCQPMMSVDPE